MSSGAPACRGWPWWGQVLGWLLGWWLLIPLLVWRTGWHWGAKTAITAVFLAIIAGAAITAGSGGGATTRQAATAPEPQGAVAAAVTATQAPTPSTASPSPSPPPPPPQPTAGPPHIGDLVRVGSLDLTVLHAGPVDTTQYNQFNDANYAVRISATNARGAKDQTYDLNALAFKVIDTNGVAYNVSFSCARCPDELSDVGLTAGGHVEGTVYFKVPNPDQIVRLQYEPLFSRNRATIELR